MPFRCACWRDDSHREHVLVHGATFLPERAPVHAVGEDAAKGHAIEEWRNVECQAVGCDAIGKCSHGQATLGMLWPYVVATFTFWLDLTASATAFTISSSVVGYTTFAACLIIHVNDLENFPFLHNSIQHVTYNLVELKRIFNQVPCKEICRSTTRTRC